MFIILLSLSLGLAWQYHDASILPFALAVYAPLGRKSWQQCRELGLAIFRMRVPVIVALIAFAIYTNGQILEVLAMPYQARSPDTGAVPLLSFIVTAMSLWFWARFFSCFEPKTEDSGNTQCRLANKPLLHHYILTVVIFLVIAATHVWIYKVVIDVAAETALAENQTVLGYIAPVLAFLSFTSWIYGTCIFNRYLPLTNNLPEALDALPYNLKVRTILLRLFPVALPSLLAAATLYNVLPRVDLKWEGLKLLLAESTLSVFIVLFGVGFLADDRFVRVLYRQLRNRLAPGGGGVLDHIRGALNPSPGRPRLGVVHVLELVPIAAFALVSLASRFRLGFVAAASLLVNAALVRGLAKAKGIYKFDGALWASYFGAERIPGELAANRRTLKNSGQGEIDAGGDASPASAPESGGCPREYWSVFLKTIDALGLSVLLAAVIVFAGHRIWPGTTLSDNAYFLMAGILASSVLFYLPVLAACVFLTLILLPAAFFIGPFVDTGKLSAPAGTLLAVNVFIVASLGFFALLLLFSHKRPFIGLFFGLIVLLSTFDLNDNHAISREEEQTPVAAKPVVQEFEAWLGSRLERWESARQGAKAGAKHPVYIVAAQGGGAYAALHAALFLAQAQDEFPGFSGHVFAISGVSGGSVGGAVFASLVHASAGKPRERGWYTGATEKFLEADLLTPVVAATLFQDTFARLVPCLDEPSFCPTQALDRARAFEGALERAWDGQLGGEANPFGQTLTQLWSPASNVPALLLNTTEVETGERVVLAPFALQREVPTLASLIDRDPALDIKLSTASGLSARFPGLTAPGWYRIETADGHSSKRRLVDGGFFEDSGVATAFDLLASLEKGLGAGRRSRVELILISVKLADGENVAGEPPHGFLEIMTPLRTLNNTRAARGKLAVSQAALALDGAVCREEPDAANGLPAQQPGPSCFYAKRVRVSELENDKGQPLPLGWLLSEVSKSRIADSIGRASECPENRDGLAVRERNSCLLQQIGKDLSDGIEPQAKSRVSPWITEVIQAR